MEETSSICFQIRVGFAMAAAHMFEQLCATLALIATTCAVNVGWWVWAVTKCSLARNLCFHCTRTTLTLCESVSCLDSSHVEWHWVIYQWYCHNIHLKRNIVPGIFFPSKQRIIWNLHKCSHPSYFFQLKEVVVILKSLKNLKSLNFFESKLESKPEAKSLRYSKNSSVLLLSLSCD